ncbi:AAEL007212-PA, partial [Aedes aegypti]
RVTTVISQLSLNGHVNPLVERAFLRKNALQLSQVIALKLYPSALSPHTLHILTAADPAAVPAPGPPPGIIAPPTEFDLSELSVL